MTSGRPAQDRPSLSVVIPSYNSARWLPSTFAALEAAVRQADLQVEVIVVDDGSTDDTADIVASLSASSPGAVELITQENRGRFLARWEGLQRARSDRVLLLDSRVLLAPDALDYVFSSGDADAAGRAWNAHVHTHSEAALVGLFWDVPTHIFWGRYLRAPRPFELTADTFDSAPKGTGAFLAPRQTLIDAFTHAFPTGDAHLVSDDTKILRHIAEAGSIRLDPGFAAIYRPRTTPRAFVRHTFDRGTLFVDSYAGTSTARSAAILALVAAPPAVLATLIGWLRRGAAGRAAGLLAAALGLAVAPVIPAAVNRCPPRSIVAYLCCLPLFVGPFWLGLLRGVVVHRRAFRSGDGGSRPGRRP